MLTRRTFAQVTAALAASRNLAAQQRPNILWLSAEDISPDLGCYGDRYAITPNIDRFAAEGARYTNAFSVAGVCAPSRSCIITGMYPSSIGTHHMRSKGVPPPYVHCFTEYLRAAGYYCTNNVKTDYNFDSPITAWDESSNQAHWRNRAQDQPFFAVFNHTITHESQARPTPEQYAKNTDRLTPAQRHDPAKAVLPPYYPDTPVVRKNWAIYYDNLTALDYQIADRLRELDEAGLAGNTIVFFWGDHGRGLPRGKRWVYDSGIRVPLLIRWPGKIKPGSVRDELVSFIDLAPSLLNVAGVPLPKHLQGQPFLGDRLPAPRKYVYGIRDRMDETYDMIRSVRDKQFKYIRNYQPEKPYAQPIAYMDEMPMLKEWRRLHAEGKLEGPQKLFMADTKPPEELYDTAADPHEIHNLAAEPKHRSTLERLRQEHEQWAKQTGDLGTLPEPELLERMRPGGKWAKTSDPVIESHDGKVKISCPTEGASIAYTTGAGAKPHWQLYSREVQIAKGSTVRAVACRLGYHDSNEVRATV